MTRQKVYLAIDSERDYQDKKWGKTDDPDYVSYDPTHFLNDIDIHLQKAKQEMYNINREGVLDEFRKIAALAVKCGEIHGLPKRKEQEDV